MKYKSLSLQHSDRSGIKKVILTLAKEGINDASPFKFLVPVMS